MTDPSGTPSAQGVPQEPPAPSVAPSPPRGAGGLPLPVLAAGLVAAAALGVIVGMKLARATTLREPPTLVRVPCQKCQEREHAEAMAAATPEVVERLAQLQAEVEHAGANGTD